MVFCTALAPEIIRRIDDAIRFVSDPVITKFASPIGDYDVLPPAASCGVLKQKHFEQNCRVGGGAKRRYPPRETMVIANAQPILCLNRIAASCGELEP